MEKQKMTTRYTAVIAMFSAISFVLVLLGKLIPNVAGFLSYEPKDAAIVIAGFIMGPMASFLISLIVSFIEMISISATGPYGFLMNVVASCAFAVPAAWIYKKLHSQKGAVIGLVAGVAAMTVCMVIWNYVITPFYMGVARETVAAMLIPVFLPFNMVKGGLNAAITLLIYRPVVGALRKAKLVEPSSSGKAKTTQTGTMIFAVVAFVTFVMLLLALIGVL